MKKIFILLILIFNFNNNLIAESTNKTKRIFEGDKNAKITIITYESLTCGHCANFHKDVYPQLKEEFIDTGLVKIEFRNFPLDMAALNAAKSNGKCLNSILTNPLSMKSFFSSG